MASLFHIRGRTAWQIAWFDGTGRRRLRSSGTSDRKVAEAIAGKLENSAAMEREGLTDPRDERFKLGARTQLLDHVKNFCQHLRDKGDCPKHVQDREGQLRRLVEIMRIDRASQLTPARVSAGLAQLRAKRDLSLRTVDRHIRAVKGLSRWLVREGLLASDPLFGLQGANPATDRRRERRALTTDEISRLVAAAEGGGVVRGMSGRDRSMLYRLALGSGLRASEIAALVPSSFELDSDPPVIVVRAENVKNRKATRQPIRNDLAEALRGWLDSRAEGTRAGGPRLAGAPPVFAVKDLRYATAAMMRHDLAAAGLPYIDEDGLFADFHALRHTYVSALVRSGASVKQCQVLARHSTPILTLAVYSHVAIHELTRALDGMPATAVSGERFEKAVERVG